MKSQTKALDVDIKMRQLALSIGDFIRYWGFRRIHGAIWAQIYVSTKPLNCTDLTKKLNLSKALISPALEELVSYQLIQEVPSDNEKNKYYKAEDNINDVIKHVLKTREQKILQQIHKDFNALKKTKLSGSAYDESKVDDIGQMVASAHILLAAIMQEDNLLDIKYE